MAVNIPGVVMMVVFYLMVLGTGIWASVKAKRVEKSSHGDQAEMTFLGNRGIHLALGIFTMTATWVGGGFILGMAESIYNPTLGLVQALLPVQQAVSFIVGALFFAKRMRDNKYVTMMDPFQIKYGKVLTAFLAVIPVLTDILFITATLSSLGLTMSVILDLPFSLCVWLSAGVAIFYTLLGGLYSVAYTDVIQLALIFFSLWLCLPFVMMSEHTSILTTAVNATHQAPWLGHLEPEKVGLWMDEFLAMSMGNLALQVFHQRILSSSSTRTAQIVCYTAAGTVFILVLPPLLIGAVAASTDWNQTTYGSPSPYDRGEASMVLPIMLLHVTPPYISVFGIAAVAAAVMSSVDSCILSAVSVFTTNIYIVIRKQASETEIKWIIRAGILFFGILGTGLTLTRQRIMVYWILSNDMTYAILLPQLICVLFFKISNGYGAVIGYLVSVVVKVLAGNPNLGAPVLVCLPGCVVEDGVYIQRAPVSTIALLCSLAATLLFSYLSALLFNRGLIPDRWDVFQVKSQGRSPQQPAGTVDLARDSRGKESAENAEHLRDPSASCPMLDSKC